MDTPLAPEQGIDSPENARELAILAVARRTRPDVPVAAARAIVS